MKKLLLISLLMLCCQQISAQGNLQFNQALLFSGVGINTVPAGKVWKVENSGQSYTNGGSSAYSSLVINGINWFPQASGGTLPSGPIWLPAGATIAGWNATTQYNIIEFNIVP
ncbi:MAG: hypothetical protein WCG64_02240 [Flavobacteriia bacterium]|jgi:hypothetical protein